MRTERKPDGPQKSLLITQGEFAVSDSPDTLISTLLGSCVACCLWDDVAQVGGANHLLLAGKHIGSNSSYDVAGVVEMECLINGILKLGGQRDRLKAKVFGGANMLGSKTRIGEMNVRFAKEFLARENIPCVSASVGGEMARNLRFWPTSGRVAMKTATGPVTDAVPTEAATKKGNDLELF